MKIFLSWSGDRSEKIGEQLRKFLCKVFDGQNCPTFFFSPEHIEPGSKWFDEVTLNIIDSEVAIILLTRDNQSSKWMHFESGAITFNGKDSSVCPFLIDGVTLEENNPLRNFQVLRNTKNDILKLVKTINTKGGYGLSTSQLKAISDKHFNTYNNQVSKIIQQRPIGVEIVPHYKQLFPESIESFIHGSLYIGAPMASLEDEELYRNSRESLLKVVSILEKSSRFSKIFSPISRIKTKSDFDGKEDSIEIGFSELKQCEYYMFVYLNRCISSVLIEIGYAIALKKKCLIFVTNRKELPFMLEQADKRNSNIKIYECTDYPALVSQMRKDGKYIFEFKQAD